MIKTPLLPLPKDQKFLVYKLYQKHFNLQSSVVRFYNVYGPYQLTEGGYTTLIGRWLNNIKNNLPCEIYGDGEKRRDFTHVDDIVDALIKIMYSKPYNKVFELGRVFCNPALMSNYTFSFLALDVEKKYSQELDDMEDIEILIIDMGEIPKLIKSGQINHSLVITAFYLLKDYNL